MSSLIGFLLAMLAQLMVLPTSWQQQHEATMTTTEITTAQQQQQLLSAAQTWISQNLSTVEATATAASPMVIPVTTLAAANVGLPASFSPTNPFGQTWQVQALQPTAGTLQVLVTAVNGTALTDLQAAGIAANVGQAGGFIPQNDSGVYPLGAARAYGNQANWNIPTAGYSGVSGGHPAALLVMTNGQVQSNALYRVAVPGQPQLNQMQTAIDMNMNNVNNAATVNAQKIVVPAGNNVQVGNSYVYGDGSNTAVRQSGGFYVQHADGSSADIAQVGNVNATGSVNASGNVNASGSMWSNGQITTNNNLYLASSGAQITNPGRLHINVGENLYLQPWSGGRTIVGGGGGSGQLEVTGRMYGDEYIQPGGASAGAACDTNGIYGRDGNGGLVCQSGVWQPVGQVASGTICGMASNGGAAGNWCQGYNPYTGCPPGYQQQGFRVSFGDGFMFWCTKI